MNISINQDTLEVTSLKRHISRNIIFLRITITIAQTLIIAYLLFNFFALITLFGNIFNPPMRRVSSFGFILSILAKVAYSYIFIFWILFAIGAEIFKNWQSNIEKWMCGILENLNGFKYAHKSVKIWLNIFCWGLIIILLPFSTFIVLFGPGSNNRYEYNIDRSAGVFGLIIVIINWSIMKGIRHWVAEIAKVIFNQFPPIDLPRKYLTASVCLIFLQIVWGFLIFGLWMLVLLVFNSPSNTHAIITVIFASFYILIGLILESIRRFAGYLTKYLMLLSNLWH